jgi:hypothetical protein
MNISNEIINRLMNTLGYRTKKELAAKLGISAPDLNNRAKSGSIKQLLIDLAIHENVNVDYLLTGKGEIFNQSSGLAEAQASYSQPIPASPPFKISDLLSKTAAILESQTTYSTALKSNIVAFHYAMTCEEQLGLANKRIDTLEEHVKAIESRLLKVNES